MSSTLPNLREHVSLFASFDQSADADIAGGNSTATVNADVARHDSNAGRFGGAMVFAARDHGWAENEFTFESKGNFPYRKGQSFDGTISMWLKGDPDADLAPEYPVDPFHISRHPADASYYLDLTRPNDWRYGSPRKLRFGFYNDSPAQDMFQGGQLIVVGDLGWGDGNWHHLVATWKNSNSGQADGHAEVHIDGQLRGWMDGYQHQFSWDESEVRIGLGQRYVGTIDEFLILNRALSTGEIEMLFSLEKPLRSVIE